MADLVLEDPGHVWCRVVAEEREVVVQHDEAVRQGVEAATAGDMEISGTAPAADGQEAGRDLVARIAEGDQARTGVVGGA